MCQKGKYNLLCKIVFQINFIEDGDRTIVYRSFGPCLAITNVDSSDNLLQAYEFLNLYITTLSQYFPNLSYQVILQNPYKLHVVLEEMVIGGHIVETSSSNALGYLRLLDDVQT